jgi:lactoylglutathione lyase
MAKPIHMMIRVLDETRAVAFYRMAFGLDIVGRYDFDGFTLVYMAGPDSPFEVELTINHGRGEPYDLGNGYGHLAVSVADLDIEHARLKEAGLTPGDIKQMNREGAKFGRFFFIADPDGYKIEVLERSGRFV